MSVYEVVIGSSRAISRETLLVQAPTLEAAIKKVAAKMKREKGLWAGYQITHANLMGEVSL